MNNPPRDDITHILARPLTTMLKWDELILPEQTMAEVQHILSWAKHGAAIQGNPAIGRLIASGYRALFYGPPGVGKSLTAALLGVATGRLVYRVDLALVMSKWIGETEKNLDATFNLAASTEAILFFDEADALFGERVNTTHANDRHANQGGGYLLQRIEEFSGLVILSSYLKANVDDAFARRFQSLIQFPTPGPEERQRLWHRAFRDLPDISADVDFHRLAVEHEVTGGQIMEVLRTVMITSASDGGRAITVPDVEHAIARELRKTAR